MSEENKSIDNWEKEGTLDNKLYKLMNGGAGCEYGKLKSFIAQEIAEAEKRIAEEILNFIDLPEGSEHIELEIREKYLGGN
jgi:hypothetical protein